MWVSILKVRFVLKQLFTASGNQHGSSFFSNHTKGGQPPSYNQAIEMSNFASAPLMEETFSSSIFGTSKSVLFEFNCLDVYGTYWNIIQFIRERDKFGIFKAIHFSFVTLLDLFKLKELYTILILRCKILTECKCWKLTKKNRMYWM